MGTRGARCLLVVLLALGAFAVWAVEALAATVTYSYTATGWTVTHDGCSTGFVPPLPPVDVVNLVNPTAAMVSTGDSVTATFVFSPALHVDSAAVTSVIFAIMLTDPSVLASGGYPTTAPTFSFTGTNIQSSVVATSARASNNQGFGSSPVIDYEVIGSPGILIPDTTREAVINSMSVSFTAPGGGDSNPDFSNTNLIARADIQAASSCPDPGPVLANASFDHTPPTTSFAISPALPNGSGGWYKGSAPTVTLSATDTGSGVASTSYTINGGSTQTYTGPFTLPDGSSDVVTYWSTDNAGNVEATNTSATYKVDTVAPSITCTAAPPGPSFLLGASGTQVTATAADATSGVVGNTSLTAPANTTTVGANTAAFNAADNAGNATSTSCPYVVGYQFGGFTAPLPKATVNSRSTLPIKFQLQNVAGQPISDTEAQSLVSPSCSIAILVIKGGPVAGCPTYSSATKQFQFNLKMTSAMIGANGVSIAVTVGGTIVTASTVDRFTAK